MNERQKKLLRVLLGNRDQFQSVGQLATALGCSEKTIRNDLKLIESILQSYPEARLVRKQGMGIYLAIAETERAQLFQTLFETDSKTAEKRVIEIAYQLLIRNKPSTLKQLAATHYTNSVIIKQDLDDIADWLKRFNLSIVSKQRIGSGISGAELDKRNALAHLSELVSPMMERNDVLDLFPSYEVKAVRRLLKGLQSKYQIDFTAGGLESMLIHALIMIRRTRQQSPIILGKDQEVTRSTSAYQMTAWLLAQMEGQFQISFSESEKIYYTWHLVSSIKQTAQNTELSESEAYRCEMVAQLNRKMQQLTMIPFENDHVLADGLFVHLHAVVHRIAYGLIIHNPLLSEIKNMYPYMFSMTVLALEDIRAQFKLDIPEDEAAYLVLHFQASIERLEKQQKLKKRILIVCHMGVGMSRLLQAKIEQQFTGIQVLDCIGKTEIEAFLTQHEVDFIISTVPLGSVFVPYVVVSPLLEARDKARLNQFLQSSESKQKTTKTNSTLLQLLDQQFIFLHVGLTHRYEVVEMMARALMEKGMVTAKFVHRALQRERSSATSIGGGIAIPHAHPETVKQSTIAVAVMERPLEWGNEKVSVVFLLAIANGEQKRTREVMQYISSISENPEMVHQLEQVEGSSEVLQILEEN